MKRYVMLWAFLVTLPNWLNAGSVITSPGTGSMTSSAGTGSIIFTPAAAAAPPAAGISLDVIASSNTYGVDGGTTFNITIGSCDKRFLTLACYFSDPGASPITGVTVGGNAMTLSTSSFLSIGNAIYTYTAPATGVKSIAVTWANNYSRPCAAVDWCGVDQTTPVEVSTCSYNIPPSGGMSTATLTTSTYGDALFDIMVISDSDGHNQAPTQPGQAQIANLTPIAGDIGISTRPATSAGTYHMGWKNLYGTSNHNQCAIGIKPSS